MNPRTRPIRLALVSPLALCALVALTAWGQEKSVNPGINKPYEDGDVQQFVERFETGNREVFAQRKPILEACKVKPGMVVADVGAGTGLFTRLFAAEVGPTGRVYAVDITPKFLDHVEKTCRDAGIKNVKTVLGKPESIELPPASVDFAFICDAYHHFEFPQRTMASVHRALRPGGQLVLVEIARVPGQSSEWAMKHIRAGQEVFTKEIEAAGFKRVNEAKFLKENYFLRFEKVQRSAP